MELKIAGAMFVVGAVGLVVAVMAYFDWRAGLACASALLFLAGIQLVRSHG